MKNIDELVERICNAPYEYTKYDKTKEETTIISKYSNDRDTQVTAISRAVYEWANEQLDEIELEKENGILQAKCYAYEQIIANSNFAPMLRNEVK